MFSYRCPSCGQPSYSSANASTVGACAHCDAPLRAQPEVPAGAAAPGARWLRPVAGARDSSGSRHAGRR